MKIVLATKNPGKLKELQELAKDLDNIEWALAPAEFDPDETGSTFTENAVLKAAEASRQTKSYALADDSGLVVDALDGRPGIYSARYCQGTDADRRHKLIAELEKTKEPRRSAAFVCAMALCAPDGRLLHTTEGRWKGRIGFQERGNNGFGYDPIFYMQDRDVSVAEMSSDEKNTLSHRAQAWQEMQKYIKMRLD